MIARRNSKVKTVFAAALLAVSLAALPSAADLPLAEPSLVFAEKDGLVAVEAEHFFEQTRTDKRAFYLFTSKGSASVKPDGDPPHVGGASGGGYLEILPDTRRTHGDKLIRGENFSPEPGKMAVLSYKVHFQNTGRYYVWVRAHSTGSEDNGLHVGIDGRWPKTGQRLQWCQGKRTWRWESKQRTADEHCGEPFKIYLEIEKPGLHTIHFSMREDGFEFDKWLMTRQRDFKRPADGGPKTLVHAGKLPASFPLVAAPPAPKPEAKRDRSTSPTKAVSDLARIEPRQDNGDGAVRVSGEPKTWHKLTLTLDGPFAHEQDNAPNPFLDYRLTATFRHPDGEHYVVPGFFAADGDAANSGAESGTKWRVHFAPDRPGKWNYTLSFVAGKDSAVDLAAPATPLAPYDGKSGVIDVQQTDKRGRDLRAHGRLQYVGKRYLQHAGSKQYFLKAGADAPETLLGYADFDNTVAGKKKVPLKSYQPHLKDWQPGDPTWKDGKGKGLIGAVNYLSEKGCNAFSFLTYNAGGDGDNVWPFIAREDKLHYDCSKLDQWGIVFDHGTSRGMYLHFKMQETEIDDHNRGHSKPDATSFVPECLDGGNLGPQRKLYCRELIARFGHNLALNWNLGEENTQTTEQQSAMIDYIAQTDPYDHHIVIHTFPNQQDKVYKPLLGDRSQLTGVSLQNSGIQDTHWQTVKWVRESQQADKPWVVAFDESGTAAHGQCPDLGYEGFDGRDKTGKMIYDEHAVRRQTLWGTLMGGGAGVEYYFGYQFVQNDLVCEDWRSRDRSWDYCRIALEFFADHEIPIAAMEPADELIGNSKHDNRKYCLAQSGQLYLVYLPKGGSTKLDLSKANGRFALKQFNPRTGEATALPGAMDGGQPVTLKAPDDGEDWLLIVSRKAD